MKHPLKLVTVALLGAALVTPAWAFEQLLGRYEGKIKQVEGYSAQLDASCSVNVGKADLFGGAVTFEVQGIEKLLVEQRRVEADLKPGSAELKWVTPGSSGKPVEVVTLRLKGDGSPQSLRLFLRWSAQHREKAIICGELSRRD